MSNQENESKKETSLDQDISFLLDILKETLKKDSSEEKEETEEEKKEDS